MTPRPSFGGMLRIVRRHADLSQRQIAARTQIAASTIARIEAGRTVPSMETFGRLVGAAGYRLLIVDSSGRRVVGFDAIGPDFDDHLAVRNAAGRHFPAHLDVREPGQPWLWWFDHYNTVGAKPPLVTFELSRPDRDIRRRQENRTALDPDDRGRFPDRCSSAYIPVFRPKPPPRPEPGAAADDWW